MTFEIKGIITSEFAASCRNARWLSPDWRPWFGPAKFRKPVKAAPANLNLFCSELYKKLGCFSALPRARQFLSWGSAAATVTALLNPSTPLWNIAHSGSCITVCLARGSTIRSVFEQLNWRRLKRRRRASQNGKKVAGNSGQR